jgi:glyoxylase-like metal-dependent hydrolase (beta-lactamase superfamily II)
MLEETSMFAWPSRRKAPARRLLIWFMTITLCVATTGCGFNLEQAKIWLITRSAEPPSTVQAHYVEPSAVHALVPGDKVNALFKRNLPADGYVLQRLTERSFWFQTRFYGTLFYVGDKGVMLFDPPENRGPQLQAAIRSVTDKPVSTIVYSYYHADHIGAAGVFIEDNNKAGRKTRVLASSATRAKMQRLNSVLPLPTETVDWPHGSFQFEGIVVELHGFEHAAHTSDHSIWYLPSEKIAHVLDLVNPDQPPFTGFADAETFIEYESNLDQLNRLDWVFLSGGHGNVGSKADVAFHQRYAVDLKQAVKTAIEHTPVGAGIGPLSLFRINSHTPLYTAWQEEVAKRAADLMRPTYGQYYGFEAGVIRNAVLVALSQNGFK